MTKDTKILFLSAAAGITFMLGVLTGDHFGQKKGYSAGACDTYCEFKSELDSLSAEYHRAIDDYRSRCDTVAITKYVEVKKIGD